MATRSMGPLLSVLAVLAILSAGCDHRVENSGTNQVASHTNGPLATLPAATPTIQVIPTSILLTPTRSPRPTATHSPVANATPTPTETSRPTGAGPILMSGQYLVVNTFAGFAADGLTPVNALYFLSMDGGILKEFVEIVGFDPRLSHNQQLIAYLSNSSSLALLDIATGQTQSRIDLNGFRCNPPLSWSSDDLLLALGCEGKLYTVSILDGSMLELTTDSDKSTWASPYWSPNGQLIVFERLPGFPQADPGEGLYLLDADCLSAIETCMTNVRGPIVGSINCPNCVTWSPDSFFLAWTSQPGISIYDVANASIRNIDLGGGREPLSIAWSPDGQWIAFTELETSGTPQIGVFLVSVDGNVVSRITTKPLHTDKLAAFWIVVP